MIETKNGNVDVFETLDRLSFVDCRQLSRALLRKAQDSVVKVNRYFGQDAFYFVTFAGCWALYGRLFDDDRDKLLLQGLNNVEDLFRLIRRLERSMDDDS